MRGIFKWVAVGIGVWIGVTGCTRPDEDQPAGKASMPTVSRERNPADIEREMEEARHQIAARADSVRREMLGVRGLSRSERAQLRRDVNAQQVATARSLGVRAGGESEIQRLVRQGRLVQLEDSTQFWVLRDLEYSVPFVTPDTKAMLIELGRRFQARLDSLGLPRYRMEVTSVLRTPESQAELRSNNANAARTVSAHEFGTTLDVAHMRFAPPASDGLTVEIPGAPDLTGKMRWVEGLVLEEVARKHAGALQAELGRVLAEMREERKVRVMMERRQAVYHMTVARRFPEPSLVD